MPFTLAHPAIVVPILRKRHPFPFSLGIIIGSVAPDFEYFLQFRMESAGAHSLFGLVAFCLPVSLLIGLAWSYIVAIPLTENMPRLFRDRFFPYAGRRLSTSDLIYFAVGAGIGAATHLLWDSVTHADGFVVTHWTFLQQSIIGAIPLYKILQHTSTLIGILVLFFAIKAMPVQKRDKRISARYWLTFFAISTLVFLVAHVVDPMPFAAKAFGHYIVRIVSSALSGLLLASLASGRASIVIDTTRHS